MKSFNRNAKKGTREIKKSKLLVPLIMILLIGSIAVSAIQPVNAAITCVITPITTPGIAEGVSGGAAYDKDGFPDGTIVGSADPGDFQIVVKCSIDTAITGVSVKLINTDIDPIDDHPDRENPNVTDFYIDDDNPQDYSSLSIGNHYFFWSLDKDQSVCKIGHCEEYQVNLSWTGPTPGFALSEPFIIVAESSTSINQNDLEAVQTTPLTADLNLGETFTACIKWEQQSSSLDALAAEIYYNGTILRLYNFTLYYYDSNGIDPGDITSGVPGGYTAWWGNDTYLNTTQMSIYPLSKSDYWIGCWNFITIGYGNNIMEIYSQTKLSPTANWKIGPSNAEINVTVVKPKITIIKNAIPDDPQDFDFTITGGLTPSSFTLDDDGDNTNTYMNNKTYDVDPGTYTVTETPVPGGWQLTNIIIDEDTPGDS
ncbi:prealbumin-like fold domain-containing protein, partial [[Eubacterium] cellulosolvens]